MEKELERRKRLPIASNFPKFQKKLKIEKPKVLVLGVAPEKHPRSERNLKLNLEQDMMISEIPCEDQ